MILPLPSSPVERYETNSGFRIYRIWNQPLPHLTGYVFLILGGPSHPDFPPTLIDAGSGERDSFSQIMAGLRVVGESFGEKFRPEDLDRIIITHAHIDHFGGVYEMVRATGAKIAVHRFDSRVVSSFNEKATLCNARYVDFLTAAGIESDKIAPILKSFGFLPGRVRSVPVDHRLEEGEWEGTRIHHFPGHSAGLIGIELDGVLFPGDLILSKTLTQNWPERFFPNCGLLRYRESLHRLATLAQERSLLLLPSHEDPIRDVSRRLEMVLKAEGRRNERLFDILENSDDPLSLDAISRKMYLTAHLNRTFFALCDVAARVEYLQLRGEIAVANYDEIEDGHSVLLYRRC